MQREQKRNMMAQQRQQRGLPAFAQQLLEPHKFQRQQEKQQDSQQQQLDNISLPLIIDNSAPPIPRKRFISRLRPEWKSVRGRRTITTAAALNMINTTPSRHPDVLRSPAATIQSAEKMTGGAAARSSVSAAAIKLHTHASAAPEGSPLSSSPSTSGTVSSASKTGAGGVTPSPISISPGASSSSVSAAAGTVSYTTNSDTGAGAILPSASPVFLASSSPSLTPERDAPEESDSILLITGDEPATARAAARAAAIALEGAPGEGSSPVFLEEKQERDIINLPENAQWICRRAFPDEGCGPYMNTRLNSTGAYCGEGYCCSKSNQRCTRDLSECRMKHHHHEMYSFGRCSKKLQCFMCEPNATCFEMTATGPPSVDTLLQQQSHIQQQQTATEKEHWPSDLNKTEKDETLGLMEKSTQKATGSGKQDQALTSDAGGIYCKCDKPYVGSGADCTLAQCRDKNPCGSHGVCVFDESAAAATSGDSTALVMETSTSNSSSGNSSGSRSQSNGTSNSKSTSSSSTKSKGISSSVDSQSHSCRCDPGYTLVRSSINGKNFAYCVDVCKEKYCGPPAGVHACVAGHDKYQCVCKPGWRLVPAISEGEERMSVSKKKFYPQKCEQFDPCSVSPCGPTEAVQHCVAEGLQYRCKCRETYTERYTETQPICVEEKYCQAPLCSKKKPVMIMSNNSLQLGGVAQSHMRQSSSFIQNSQIITTTDDSDNSGGGGTTTNTNTVIGITVAAMGGMMILLLLWWWYIRRRRTRHDVDSGHTIEHKNRDERKPPVTYYRIPLRPEEQEGYVPRTRKTIFDEDVPAGDEGTLHLQWE